MGYRTKTERDGWSHLSTARQAHLAIIQREIEALEQLEWTPELGRLHDDLLKERSALGWNNPWLRSAA